MKRCTLTFVSVDFAEEIHPPVALDLSTDLTDSLECFTVSVKVLPISILKFFISRWTDKGRVQEFILARMVACQGGFLVVFALVPNFQTVAGATNMISNFYRSVLFMIL